MQTIFIANCIKISAYKSKKNHIGTQHRILIWFLFVFCEQYRYFQYHTFLRSFSLSVLSSCGPRPESEGFSPRTKKVSTGHFFTPAAPGPSFRIRYSANKKPPRWGGFLLANDGYWDTKSPFCGKGHYISHLPTKIGLNTLSIVAYPTIRSPS